MENKRGYVKWMNRTIYRWYTLSTSPISIAAVCWMTCGPPEGRNYHLRSSHEISWLDAFCRLQSHSIDSQNILSANYATITDKDEHSNICDIYWNTLISTTPQSLWMSGCWWFLHAWSEHFKSFGLLGFPEFFTISVGNSTISIAIHQILEWLNIVI